MNPTGEPKDAGDGNGARPDGGRLEELRGLLLAPEQKKIEELQERLSFPAQTDVISEALPQAIRQASARNGLFAQAITPAVETALKESVRRDPSVLTDAVFPIIGAAIRKAIAEAFEKMLQSMNQAMEHGISVKGLKWRLEGFRTGRSFAEVVLSHTLIYRVEQVFLMHKESGLLLQNVESPNVTVHDMDMVSGMLTAIQDFARDSFQVSHGEGLGTLQVGELHVWIETGPHITLAAVIRGIAPMDFRSILQDAVQRISAEQRAPLLAFKGDSEVFVIVRPILESCLRMQLSERSDGSTKRSALVWLALVLLALFGGVGWHHVSKHRADEAGRVLAERRRAEADERKRSTEAEALAAVRTAQAAEEARWADCLSRIKGLEGIVIIQAFRRDGRIILEGMRDPLAPDPLRPVIAAAGFDADRLEAKWETYYALSPGLVLKRASERLRPPPTVRLRLLGDGLIAEGHATAGWIAESQRLALTAPGIGAYNVSGVVDDSAADLAAKATEIDHTQIIFGEGVQLTPEQLAATHRLALRLIELRLAARRDGRRVTVTVTGHTTEKGTERFNLKLGQQRAEQVIGLLVKDEVEPAMLTLVSVAAREPSPDAALLDDLLNRRVTFRVAIDDPARKAEPR